MTVRWSAPSGPATHVFEALLLGALSAACGGTEPTATKSGSSNVEFVDTAQALGLSFEVQVGEIFDEVTDSDQRLTIEQTGNGAAVGDYDGDGDLDVYLLGHVHQPNQLFRNDLDSGEPGFTNATPDVLADEGLSRAAQFADLDNDGDLDLVLANDDDGNPTTEPSKLFENQGNGRFEDVTDGSGFAPMGYLIGGLALADYDGDGLLDIYVTIWGYDHLGTGDPMFPGSNRLYRNLGDFEFEDVTEASLGSLSTNCFAALFTDFDGDAHPDIFVAVDNGPERCYRNDAGRGFEEVGIRAGLVHPGNDMGLASADFDDDGDLDVYSTNITDPTGLLGVSRYNAFFVNQLSDTGALTFSEEAEERGVEDTYWGWGTEFVDVENDGDLDIVAVSGFDQWIEKTYPDVVSPLYQTPSVLFINDGSGHFERKFDAGFDDERDSRALIAFDYDRDGDQDLLITNVEQPTMLLENRSTGGGHWLTVRLHPDARAIGAAVYATLDGVEKRRDVLAGRSFLSGTPSEVHFGLGRSTNVERLRVVWSDGSETVLRDVKADRVLDLSFE